MADAADATPALLPHSPPPSRAWTPGSCSGARRPGRRRPRPAARRGLADRRAHRRQRRRGDGEGPASWPTPAPWTRSWSPTWPRPRHWRIREDGAGLAARRPTAVATRAGRTPPSRALGAYLRDFEALLDSTGCRAAVRALRRRLRARAHRLPLRFREDRGARGTGPSSRTPPAWSRATAARCPASTATAARSELPPTCTPRGPAAVREGQGGVRPRRPAQPGRPGAAPARRRHPSPPSRRRERLALAYRHDGGFAAAVHRCTGVGKCRAACPPPAGSCARRGGPRARRRTPPAAGRVLQEMLAPGGPVRDWRSPEVHEALDLCLSCKGCSRDCPTGVDMASYKAEVLHQSYRRRLRPAPTTRSAGCRGGPTSPPAPRLVNAVLASRLGGRLAKWSAGMDQRRDVPRSRCAPSARSGAKVATSAPTVRRTARPWRCGWIRSPTTSPPRWRRRRPRPGGGRLPGAGARRRHLLRADLDHDRPARHRPHDAPPHRRDAAPPGGRRDADRGVEPSCTAALRSEALELVGGPAAERSPPAPARSPSCSPPRPAGSRRRWRGWRSSRSRATTPRSWAGRPTQAAGRRRRPRHPPRRLLRLAGNWGVERGHHDVSVAIAEQHLLPAVRDMADDAVVLADGFSCRTQLDQLAGRRGLPRRA